MCIGGYVFMMGRVSVNVQSLNWRLLHFWDRIGCRMLDVGCSMLDVGCRMLDEGCLMLDVGCRMLDVGCRIDFCPIQSYPILSYPILSNPILSYPAKNLRFWHRSDGRHCFGIKYFKLYCVLQSSANENWFELSTNTVLTTKFLIYFNSTLLCFPTNCSKCCYIDTLFFQNCHTLKTRLNTQIPIHMSSVDLYKGQVSLASR